MTRLAIWLNTPPNAMTVVAVWGLLAIFLLIGVIEFSGGWK